MEQVRDVLDFNFSEYASIEERVNGDEPETLSSDWIAGKKMWVRNKIPFHMDVDYAVPVNDLQNLIVPKQEEVDRIPLYDLLAEHINEELKEFDTHANGNDMNGIIENILEDIDERIIEYRDTVNKD